MNVRSVIERDYEEKLRFCLEKNKANLSLREQSQFQNLTSLPKGAARKKWQKQHQLSFKEKEQLRVGTV